MSHTTTRNNKINKIHGRDLRNAYKKETNLFFHNLLKKDKSVSIHQRNLYILASEIAKVRNDLGPQILKHISHFIRKPYNLRNDSTMKRQRNHTVCFGTESISSLAPKI